MSSSCMNNIQGRTPHLLSKPLHSKIRTITIIRQNGSPSPSLMLSGLINSTMSPTHELIMRPRVRKSGNKQAAHLMLSFALPALEGHSLERHDTSVNKLPERIRWSRIGWPIHPAACFIAILAVEVNFWSGVVTLLQKVRSPFPSQFIRALSLNHSMRLAIMIGTQQE